MSMYKRPSKRVKCVPTRVVGPLIEGTFLHSLCAKGEPNVYKFKKGPVYQQELYLKALERHYKDTGIPYAEPELMKATPYQPLEMSSEPELLHGDRIQVVLRVLKNGTVRVKVNCAIAMMYDKYYRRLCYPPIKVILQAYKSHGFSQTFLEKIKKSHERKMEFAKKVPGILAKIFDKEPVKKIKKEKKKEPDQEFIEEDEEEEPIPAEEGELDVEPDVEDEEVVEEEYFSEPET